jgi:hypothetical protein
MAPTIHLSAYEGEIFVDPTLYKSTLGTLQYLCITRPDISFCVNKLSQFMHKPLSSEFLFESHYSQDEL